MSSHPARNPNWPRGARALEPQIGQIEQHTASSERKCPVSRVNSANARPSKRAQIRRPIRCEQRTRASAASSRKSASVFGFRLRRLVSQPVSVCVCVCHSLTHSLGRSVGQLASPSGQWLVQTGLRKSRPRANLEPLGVLILIITNAIRAPLWAHTHFLALYAPEAGRLSDVRKLWLSITHAETAT